jgi:purine-binding chemotaxis protein CheW
MTRLCAIPLQYVSETMRPLPIEPVPGMPPSVRGLSIIRGVPVPVVDVATAIAGGGSTPTRFVTVTVGARSVALAVDSIVGVRTIDASEINELPMLLANASNEGIAAIGILDAKLLLLLQSARLIPDDVWTTLEQRGASS